MTWGRHRKAVGMRERRLGRPVCAGWPLVRKLVLRWMHVPCLRRILHVVLCPRNTLHWHARHIGILDTNKRETNHDQKLNILT